MCLHIIITNSCFPISGIQVKVARQDDMPIDDKLAEIEVYTCVDYERTESDQSKYVCSSFTGSYSLPVKKLNIPSNGIVPIDLDIPMNTTKIKMRVNIFFIIGYSVSM